MAFFKFFENKNKKSFFYFFFTKTYKFNSNTNIFVVLTPVTNLEKKKNNRLSLSSQEVILQWIYLRSSWNTLCK